MTLATAPWWIRVIALITCAWLSVLCAHAQPPTVAKIPRPKAVPVSKTLAKSLAAWDKKRLQDAKDCAKDAAPIKAREKDRPGLYQYDVRYEVLLDSPEIFSVGSVLNIYCGGPYPSVSEIAAVFDVSAGKMYDPLKLYAIADGTDHGGSELLPSVRTLIRQNLLAQRKPIQKNDECIGVIEQDEIRFLDRDTLALGPKGLHVMYTGPHVVQGCYGPVVLPYASLKKYRQAKEAQRIRWTH
jgi:hypothetical protein